MNKDTRAVNGPPAQLAVKRIAASDLSAHVTLDDSDAMAKGLSLSNFPPVQISVRISKTGNAIASSGDIQGRSGLVTVGQGRQIELVSMGSLTRARLNPNRRTIVRGSRPRL